MYYFVFLGHQILETIDEPSCQRLDRPVHCPKDIYQVCVKLCGGVAAPDPTIDPDDN